VNHRHLNTDAWTLAAIDSTIEYGGLPDWRELFTAAERDRAIAERILTIARSHPTRGSALARHLVYVLWPMLKPTERNAA
jgi:hypothetical protein